MSLFPLYWNRRRDSFEIFQFKISTVSYILSAVNSASPSLKYR